MRTDLNITNAQIAMTANDRDSGLNLTPRSESGMSAGMITDLSQ